MNVFTLRNILAVILVIVLGAGGYFGYKQLHSTQKLTIEFSKTMPGYGATVYRFNSKDGKADPKTHIDKNSPIKKLSQTETLKLKKGRYVVVSGGGDYEERFAKVALFDSPQTVKVEPNYSRAKLTSMLPEQKAELHRIIASSVKGFSNKYRLVDGKLYKNGEWYATSIVPNISEEERRLDYHDAFGIVLRQENGTWKVVTNPPELVLNVIKYPNVPRDVLIDVNKHPDK